jgi:hypothetical protein
MKKTKPALALMAVIPAAMVAVAMPVLANLHASDSVRGVVVGCLLGISLVALIALGKRRDRSA